MAGVKKMETMIVALVIAAMMNLGGKMARAQMHHVVGGDRGWDSSSNLSSWSDGRIFRVGDKIWFTYSAAQGHIAELKSKEEYESCDLNNPIRMLTDGLDTVSLVGEGIRYFASSRPENCKGGLKLHVEVLPPQPSEHDKQAAATVTTVATSESSAIAAGPTTPSGSTHSSEVSFIFLIGLFLCFVGV